MEIKRAGRVLTMVSVMLMAASVTLASETRQDTISTLFELLFAVYDNDSSLIPDDPSGVIALQYSKDSRDQLAWAIFELIRYGMNPDLRPPEEDIMTAEYPETDTRMMASSLESPEGERMLLQAEWDEELTGPLWSCILEPKTYRITSLPLQIEGHVVIPAGTRLIAPYDPNHAVIEVMPGGLLDTGKAAFYTAENYPAILPAVEIMPEDSSALYSHNAIGVYIHRGADSKTRLENLQIVGCQVGLVVDEELQFPLRNVITVGCYDGIQLYAPADIIDCQFWLNGSVSYKVFEYVGTAIYVSLDWPGEKPEINIDRATLYGADVVLYIEGGRSDPNGTDPNQVVPYVNVINSCLCGGYYCGLYQSPGEAVIDLQHCGFGWNKFITNVSLPLTECVQLSFNPFSTAEDDLERLYISPYSELIDAGYGIATDGTGVTRNMPDTGRMDIGAHFSSGFTGGFGIPSSPADFNWDGCVDESDLALMNACMGATNDPNMLRMDFDWDSFINLPDFAVYARDRGWAADPNFSVNPDPNAVRSDFNADGFVDLGDLAVLAELWMTPVFDEYRVCGLCNLHTGIDPNDPNAPGAAIIDQRDMDLFMADWGKQGYIDCSISFKDEQNSSIEPNNLSGEIRVSVDNYLPSTVLIFAQIDGCPVGSSYLCFDEQPSIAIPTDEYGNGWHILTIGGYTTDDGCWIENIEVKFHNTLYFLSVQRVYEPNEPISFAAYNTEPNTLASVRLYADGEQLLWVQTFGGDSICGTIPANITVNHIIDYVSFSSGSGALVSKTPVPKVSRSNIDLDVKALMVMPDTKLFALDPQVRYKVLNAFSERGIKVLPLTGIEATWENVARYGQYGFVKYIYILAHGDYIIDKGQDTEVLRTFIKLADGWTASCKHSEFTSPPSWCKPLPGLLESYIRTWASMGFDRLVFVYSDACYGGRLKIDDAGNLVEGQPGQIGVFDGPHSDFSHALKLNVTSESRAYHGWWDKGWVGTVFQTTYQEWAKDVWQELGDGSNLDEALNYAISETESFSDESPVKNYRLKGQGLLSDIRLRSN